VVFAPEFLKFSKKRLRKGLTTPSFYSKNPRLPFLQR
jgi:hypothetical protein